MLQVARIRLSPSNTWLRFSNVDEHNIVRSSFRISTALQRLCSGILAGACAVLRLFAKDIRKRRKGMKLNMLRAFVAPVLPIDALSRSRLIILFTSLFIPFVSSPALADHVSAGTVINNAAVATYIDGPSSGIITRNSNTVGVTTVVMRTRSSIELLQYAPASPAAQMVSVAQSAYSTSGTMAGPFVTEGPPVPAGSSSPINLNNPMPLASVSQYHAGEPIFVRLTDLDQNLDPTAAETVLVTLKDDKSGDSEVVRLVETGPNSGIFVGYLQSTGQATATGSGLLHVTDDSRITTSYTDIADSTDSSTMAVMVDPYGKIFSSATGLPVNGASVTLIDAATNQAAKVFGDDGVSTFPATIITGGTAVDSGGRNYSFPPGEYRYPYLVPGSYHIAVTPPAGFRAPSQVATEVIQGLPNGPFAILNPGSRGEVFPVNAGPAIHMDIPIDPFSSRLYVIKSAGKTIVAPGDFIQYKVSVQNVDTTAAVPAVTLNDRLPVGFRYRKGSAKIAGVTTTDPSLSSDGRTMTYTLGDIAASASSEVSYVAEVAAGANMGMAINTAVAVSSLGVVSNAAQAAVQVTEDLFSSKATIVGRVFADGCGKPDVSNEGGLEGVRIFMEDGTYVITDKKGMYHFVGVTPGTHVVQIDLESLPKGYEIIECEQNTRFAGKAYSQFVDVQGGVLWRADFHAGQKPPMDGEVGFELNSGMKKTEKTNLSPGEYEVLEYSMPHDVSIRVSSVPVRNLRLTVVMPEGVSYEKGSSRLDTAQLPDPAEMEGVLTYRLEDRPAGWNSIVHFTTRVPARSSVNKVTTKVMLTFDTPKADNQRTSVAESTLAMDGLKQPFVPDLVLHPYFPPLGAELSEQDKEDLSRLVEELKSVDIKQIVVEGHTDSSPIRGSGKKKFADNYVLSKARAETVGQYIAEALHIPSAKMVYLGKGPDEPVASNKTKEGRDQNRRVKLMVMREGSIDLSGQKESTDKSGWKSVSTKGLRPGEEWNVQSVKKTEQDEKKMPDYTTAWLEAAGPGFEWLWPGEGHYPSIPATKIAIKHDPTRKLKLLLNGSEVSALYLDGTLKRQDNTVAVSAWRGVHLEEGDNFFEAVQYDENGAETARLKRTIHYSSPPVKTELATAQSKLIADGKNPPVIAVRFIDKDGHPAREGIIGEYSIDPPYISRQRAEDLQKNPLTASTSDKLKYQVGDNGVALIELQPTTNTGEAVIRFPMADGVQEIRAWLKPSSRDWILVGLAEGTVGYNVVKGNMETFASTGDDDKLYDNNRIAFYAKGMVKGEWLLTIAYDSNKHAYRDQNGLYQTIDPNKYYTLYGDATDQRPDAASARSLYLKIERDQFYALFGDYDTGLTITELSRYSRQLNGVKSEMKTDHFNYTLFVSQNDQTFVKDEIRGDGTSGLYQLSRKSIVLNSETVVIETRDRYKSEVILSSQPLSRYLDYSIDYDTGTLFFKSPVFSTDVNFNPLFIVVRYEIFGASGNSYTYGGRGAVRVLNNKVEIGATHIHEENNGGIGALSGVDATVKVDEHTQIKTEIATSKNNEGGIANEGSAYLAELSHRSENAEGKAYVREQAAGFGLGQQSNSETGTRKVGADLNYRFDKLWSVGGEVFQQNVLATGAVRDMAEIRGKYTSGKYDLLAGVRSAEDTLTMGQTYRSDQLFASAKYQLTDRVALRLSRDQSLDSNDNVDFPTMTTVGADYKLSDTATFYADQEWTQGSGIDTETSRIGIKAAPWTGGQIGSTMEQQSTESGMRLFSTTGLKQSWQITKKWSVDAGLDRSTTLRNTSVNTDGSTAPYIFNTNVPPAVGTTEDFTAISLGVGYREEKWSWTARVEDRVSTSEDKFGVFAGANGEAQKGLGLAAGLQAFKSAAASGLEQLSSDLRLSLVYRPQETRIIILDRLDYLINEQHGGDSIESNSWRLVNNFVSNIKTDNRMQLSVQYGSKYVQETIDQNDYRGYTDLTGLEGRYDITKKWDIGLRELMLHSWSVDQMKYGTGASVGYNAGKNIWVSVGYNFTGFKDRDFSRADFTSQGPFVKLRMKFDQASVRDAVKWFSGQ